MAKKDGKIYYTYELNRKCYLEKMGLAFAALSGFAAGLGAGGPGLQSAGLRYYSIH